jgi:hypothetical protein
MQLIWFHRVLIGTAILFFAGFGVWLLLRGGATAMLMALASFAAAAALGYYLRRLRSFLRM